MQTRLQHLQEYLKEDPDSAFLQFALAQEYTKLNRLEDGLRTYLNLRNSHPEYVGLYYHLGQLYETLGRHSEAAEVYRSGIEQATLLGETHARQELSVVLQLLE